MALSSIALSSRALLSVGAGAIASFDEGTAEAEVSAALFGPVSDAVVSSHPWSFATAQMTLAKLTAPPVADYASAFQLPDDFLRALSLGQGGRGRGVDYRIAERRLHANADQVVLTYIFRPQPEDFPPFFDQALIARLAAEFCIPLTESTSRSETLWKRAEAEFRRAKSIDAQQETPARIDDFILTQGRGQ